MWLPRLISGFVLMSLLVPAVTEAALSKAAGGSGYSGISGVPAFFAAKFRDELLALRGDAGARRVIDAHRNEVVTIPFEAAAFDVDTDAAISL